MTISMPMPSARLQELWGELQRTRPTTDRYQELVKLIRAEASAYLTQIDGDHGPHVHSRDTA
jgi:hypothetical protein